MLVAISVFVFCMCRPKKSSYSDLSFINCEVASYVCSYSVVVGSYKMIESVYSYAATCRFAANFDTDICIYVAMCCYAAVCICHSTLLY